MAINIKDVLKAATGERGIFFQKVTIRDLFQLTPRNANE